MNQMATLRYEWNTVPWPRLERNVFKLQKQIYRASQQGNRVLVRKLQRLLLASGQAKLLAVRKVTQDNRGKKTAGVDGKTALTKTERQALVQSLRVAAKASPIRRVWIPKPGKPERRPLGIPTIEDRARQALVKMALEPEWEARFEPNSYGFRPGRCCQDAMQAIFGAIHRKQAYVLDADIAGCFDHIQHGALLQKLATSARLRRIIKAWLKAGILDQGKLQPNEEGTPQGGIISPLLANIALHGLETDLKQALRQELLAYMRTKRGKASYLLSGRMLSLIRYADDFVVLHEDVAIIEKAREYIQSWLQTVGLSLHPQKTRICHTFLDWQGTSAGFDFLGFHVRQYGVPSKASGYVTLIKPSPEKLRQHLQSIKVRLRAHRGEKQATVIRNLNPLIKGWSRYYQSVTARKTFEKADHETFQKLWRWARYRHPHKGRRWVKDRYFLSHQGDQWRFKTQDGNILVRHSDHKIKRFAKVKGMKSPYDGDFTYWASRMGRFPGISPRVANLLKRQHGKCAHCKLVFQPEAILEVHHQDRNTANNKMENLQVLHGHCHDTIHRRGMNVNHSFTEEPDVSKGTRPVLEPSRGSDAPA